MGYEEVDDLRLGRYDSETPAPYGVNIIREAEAGVESCYGYRCSTSDEEEIERRLAKSQMHTGLASRGDSK